MLSCCLVTVLSTGYASTTIEQDTALAIISDVTDCINLGTRLSIPQVQLNEISQTSLEEQKMKLVQVWFEHDPNPTYGTLILGLLHVWTGKEGRKAQEKLCKLILQMKSMYLIDLVICVTLN